MKDNLRKSVELLKQYNEDGDEHQVSFHLGYCCACLESLNIKLEAQKIYFRGFFGREKYRDETLMEQVIRISEKYLNS